LPVGLGPLALVFMLGGVQVAIEETLEVAFCAELVEAAQHGMAFGVSEKTGQQKRHGHHNHADL